MVLSAIQTPNPTLSVDNSPVKTRTSGAMSDATLSGDSPETLSMMDEPTHPTVKWNRKRVLDWIQEREPELLEDDDLKSFKKARIGGRAFLHSNREFFQTFCGLSPGASLALESLANEVKELKHSELPSFIPH